MTFLLPLEGGEIIATPAFDIRILGVKLKVNRMAVADGRRGLRAEYVEHGVQRQSDFLMVDRLENRSRVCMLRTGSYSNRLTYASLLLSNVRLLALLLRKQRAVS